MRGKDLQEKEDMEETHNFDKRSINEVFTSATHIVTQEKPQTQFLAEDMNMGKRDDICSCRKFTENKSISLPTK